MPEEKLQITASLHIMLHTHKTLFHVLRPRPIVRVAYGAETWTMTKKEEQALLVFKRKIFRIIYDPKYENGEWKSRTNRELEELSKGENIVKWIKGQRINFKFMVLCIMIQC